jgi:hypothetical protein
MKNITNFTQENALTLFNSADDFPVDFELAWEWLGFSRKDTAKESLTGGIFEEGRDFLYSRNNPGIEKIDAKTAKSINKKAGEQQKIWLTIDCFKTWGMMAATEKGKEVRKYFLECERNLKKLAALAAVQSEAKLSSLTDLTEAQLYNLMAYAQAKDSGMSPNAELIAGIPPFFATAPFTALALAHEKRMLADQLAKKLASDIFSEVHRIRGFEEESDRILVDDFAQDVRRMESDIRFKVPFDKFEKLIARREVALAASQSQRQAQGKMSTLFGK